MFDILTGKVRALPATRPLKTYPVIEEVEDVLLGLDLQVKVEGNLIVKGLALTVPRGEVHALMGPNGSGKSLANVLLGHPSYEVVQGRIWYKGQDVTHLTPDERAKAGIFLAFQYPVEVPGVSVMNFLRTALSARQGAEISV